MQRAFTLIELLVVITIIVVLLALLVPAMDKAIYQAELAVCGAHQKGIAGGVTLYASSFKRSYPVRGGIDAQANDPKNALKVGLRPNSLRHSSAYAFYADFDDRRALEGYIALPLTLCPLMGRIDLSDAANDADANLFSNYGLWYGWRFAGHPGMNKVGDRFAWTEGSVTTAVRHRFDVLSSDDDMLGVGYWALGSHPDAGGMMSPFVMQSQAPNDQFAITGHAATDGKWTISRWEMKGSHLRGAVDMNFAHADGSVSRLAAVEPQGDERVVAVPFESSSRDYPTYIVNLPR